MGKSVFVLTPVKLVLKNPSNCIVPELMQYYVHLDIRQFRLWDKIFESFTHHLN